MFSKLSLRTQDSSPTGINPRRNPLNRRAEFLPQGVNHVSFVVLSLQDFFDQTAACKSFACRGAFGALCGVNLFHSHLCACWLPSTLEAAKSHSAVMQAIGQGTSTGINTAGSPLAAAPADLQQVARLASLQRARSGATMPPAPRTTQVHRSQLSCLPNQLVTSASRPSMSTTCVRVVTAQMPSLEADCCASQHRLCLMSTLPPSCHSVCNSSSYRKLSCPHCTWIKITLCCSDTTIIAMLQIASVACQRPIENVVPRHLPRLAALVVW